MEEEDKKEAEEEKKAEQTKSKGVNPHKSDEDDVPYDPKFDFSATEKVKLESPLYFEARGDNTDYNEHWPINPYPFVLAQKEKKSLNWTDLDEPKRHHQSLYQHHHNKNKDRRSHNRKRRQSLTQSDYDPLEHTRYGEGNHPSTNEMPIPNPLYKPLVITNAKDKHDFKMPFKNWNDL